jgi:lambda family phage portal protein
MVSLNPLNWFRSRRAEKPSMQAWANAASRAMLKARYDAAQTNGENRNHWAGADDLSAVSANSAAVRQVLRKRSRYEVANNSYARGMVLTLANDVIGTGPRLQLLTKDSRANKRIQKSFAKWARAVGLAAKLRTMRMARCQDGEAFAMLVTNKRLNHPIKLDLRLVEADQICDSMFGIAKNERILDGIEYDEDDNPIKYYVARNHPGGSINSLGTMSLDAKPVDAADMIHWFRVDRPGQVRGIPEITAALPLYAQLRRFTLAVIAAAESAADFSVLLKTNATPEEADAMVPFDEQEIVKRMMVALPAGAEMQQLRAEQPTTTYKDFKGEILNEISRCLNMPFNVAAGNSSGYNYSSGRLDHQTYFRAIGIDQCDCEEVVLDRIFAAWLDEAALVPDLLPAESLIAEMEHNWFWDAPEHVDPAKEANAQATRLANQTTTLADEWAAKGWDWEEKLEQLKIERKKLVDAGLAVKDITATVDVAKMITALMDRVEELENQAIAT